MYTIFIYIRINKMPGRFIINGVPSETGGVPYINGVIGGTSYVNGVVGGTSYVNGVAGGDSRNRKGGGFLGDLLGGLLGSGSARSKREHKVHKVHRIHHKRELRPSTHSRINRAQDEDIAQIYMKKKLGIPTTYTRFGEPLKNPHMEESVPTTYKESFKKMMYLVKHDPKLIEKYDNEFHHEIRRFVKAHPTLDEMPEEVVDKIGDTIMRDIVTNELRKAGIEKPFIGLKYITTPKIRPINKQMSMGNPLPFEGHPTSAYSYPGQIETRAKTALPIMTPFTKTEHKRHTDEIEHRLRAIEKAEKDLAQAHQDIENMDSLNLGSIGLGRKRRGGYQYTTHSGGYQYSTHTGGLRGGRNIRRFL
jgi:hypothetical protein